MNILMSEGRRIALWQLELLCHCVTTVTSSTIRYLYNNEGTCYKQVRQETSMRESFEGSSLLRLELLEVMRHSTSFIGY